VDKPWIRQWKSELQEVRAQATAELGELLDVPTFADGLRDYGHGREAANQKFADKTAYW